MKTRKGAERWVCAAGLTLACGSPGDFSASAPARGPSEMLEGARLLNETGFPGGSDPLPPVGPSASVCDAECARHCDALGLVNPVNRGLCPRLWGVGLPGSEIDAFEACRRLYVDMIGRFPSLDEVTSDCVDADFGSVVTRLMESDEFVRLNRRRWADKLRYDTETVSVERVYDADRIVELTYQGRVPFDQFAAVISAHPVLTRRYATPQERVDALHQLFLGRPAFANERSDLGRLYALWEQYYYDHPKLGVRLPDAFIRFRCTEGGGGACTSLTHGAETVVLEPDSRADWDGDVARMWSGYLSAREWELLQAPGRLIAAQPVFWEYAVNQVLVQYLGYNLSALAPEVGTRLVRHLIDHQGDIRAVHHAVLTSWAYRQTHRGEQEGRQRFEYGPLNQVDAEAWVDSLRSAADLPKGSCDWRLNRPQDFLDTDSPYAANLVRSSGWTWSADGQELDRDYAELVRTLGGCPDNSQGGRFKTISVLSTANQLNYAGTLCDPALEDTSPRAASEVLLPPGVRADAALSAELGQSIVEHLVRRLLTRQATTDELGLAADSAAACMLSRCSAEQFARPVCYALLSSAEELFY